MQEKLSVLSTLADKEALGELSEAMRSAASKEAVEALHEEINACAAGLKTMEESSNARFELKADARSARDLEDVVKRLGRAVDEKLGVQQAEKMLEHKADAATVQKLASSDQSSTGELTSLASRVEASEGALHSARRDAADAVEHARASAAALTQLQGASDKHWQITRSSREEQAQLVKAVRALLLDAELRVNGDQASAHPPSAETLGDYGQHGWSSPAARLTNGGAGGCATKSCSSPTPPLPRVAAAPQSVGASGSAMYASPKKAPFSEHADALARRRRLLAGASIGPDGGAVQGGLGLPAALAMPTMAPGDRSLSYPSGAQTHRSPLVHGGRSRMYADPYPTLVRPGIS